MDSFQAFKEGLDAWKGERHTPVLSVIQPLPQTRVREEAPASDGRGMLLLPGQFLPEKNPADQRYSLGPGPLAPASPDA
ncbi:hypothetical protein AAIH32_16000 [Pseudarthrobacter oxydans]|uniref:hypothetical protein n=1 Tax=Pseudarthrobacter oxydans TaxID=1671 RepID=UPI003D2CF5F1